MENFHKNSSFKYYLFLALVSTLVQKSLLQSVSPREPRLSLAESNSYDLRDHEGPGTYAFGYDIEDPATGNTQFREEQRHPNGTVTGSYGYVEADGNVHTVRYVADERGYRAEIEDSRDKPQAPPKATFKNPYIQSTYYQRPTVASYPQIFPYYNRRYTTPYYPRVPDHSLLPPVTRPVVYSPSPNLELPIGGPNLAFAHDSKYYVSPAVYTPQIVRDRNDYYYRHRY